MTFIEALAREEGFFEEGSRAQRNCNPGNIDFDSWSKAHGAVLETIPNGYNESPRFAAWPNAQDGWTALHDLLISDYLGLTVAQAIAKFAPSTENDTEQYIKNVCSFASVTPETILTPDNIGDVPISIA